MDDPPVTLDRSPDAPEEGDAVVIIDKDGGPAVPARRDVPKGTWIFFSERSRHNIQTIPRRPNYPEESTVSRVGLTSILNDRVEFGKTRSRMPLPYVESRIALRLKSKKEALTPKLL